MNGSRIKRRTLFALLGDQLFARSPSQCSRSRFERGRTNNSLLAAVGWPQHKRKNQEQQGNKLFQTTSLRWVSYSPHASTSGRRQQVRQQSNSPAFSRRELASLEEELITRLGRTVEDPILHKDLNYLGWLTKRIHYTEGNNGGNLSLSLQMPTLLHPSLDDLKNSIRIEAKKILEQLSQNESWDPFKQKKLHRCDVHVEMMPPRKPIPIMAERQAVNEQRHRHNAATGKEDTLLSTLGPGLESVSHYVAVYSCKGGVGKSTIAVNLAYELCRMGGRVGLLDVDVYGPSLPVLIQRLDDPTVRKSPIGNGMVYPITHRGVKLLSLGFVSPKASYCMAEATPPRLLCEYCNSPSLSGVPGSGFDGGAAVMRGPMAGRVVSQLLKGTDWGDLDVLILDLPPGTGDVQLSVCQDIPLSGAVAVTTPSRLALSDARKGVEMFTSMGVPTLAAVENMAFFTCEGGTRHYPFGKGLLVEGSDLLDSPNVVQMPISTVTNDANDFGSPLSIERPETASEELTALQELAMVLSKELLLVQYGRAGADFGEDSLTSTLSSPHHVRFPTDSAPNNAREVADNFDVASTVLMEDNANEGFVARFFSESRAIQIHIPGMELRARNPKTGERLEDHPESSSPSNVTTPRTGLVIEHHHSRRNREEPRLFPARVERKGRYGFAVEYADGATVIYSMISIAKAAGGTTSS